MIVDHFSSGCRVAFGSAGLGGFLYLYPRVFVQGFLQY